jgi:hypothetical protein
MDCTLALVSCTKRKLQGHWPAADLYSASAGFRAAYAYARKRADNVVILSAKHGAVRPTDVLEHYEECLRGSARARKQAWAKATYTKLRNMPEYTNAHVVLWLAGRDYYSELLPLMEMDEKRADMPLAHLPQGKQRQWLQRQLSTLSNDTPRS